MTTDGPPILGELELDLTDAAAEQKLKKFIIEVRRAAHSQDVQHMVVARRVVDGVLHALVVANPVAGDEVATVEQGLADLETDVIERVRGAERDKATGPSLKAPSGGVGLRRR